MTRLTRRNFLKGTGMAALALGTGAILDAVLSGCATSRPNERPSPSKTQPETSAYPPLAGKKIQPPENGCLVGLHRYNYSHDTDRIIDSYQKELDNKPAFFTLAMVDFSYFPQYEMAGIATKGVIPNVLHDYSASLQDIAKGSHDVTLTTLAKEAKKYGEQHGGFFYTPMPELNGNWRPWARQPNAAKGACQHAWQIFEDNGANQYATWVWEVYCPEGAKGGAEDPQNYYPGDKYVDWIGLSAYSRTQFYNGNMSYNELTRRTYIEMHNNHLNKPIMQAEFGKTQGSDQPYWLKNAYKTIKSRPGMKAALYWDQHDRELNDNLYLSKESFEVIKEIFKDPYFIGAK